MILTSTLLMRRCSFSCTSGLHAEARAAGRLARRSAAPAGAAGAPGRRLGQRPLRARLGAPLRAAMPPTPSCVPATPRPRGAPGNPHLSATSSAASCSAFRSKSSCTSGADSACAVAAAMSSSRVPIIMICGVQGACHTGSCMAGVRWWRAGLAWRQRVLWGPGTHALPRAGARALPPPTLALALMSSSAILASSPASFLSLVFRPSSFWRLVETCVQARRGIPSLSMQCCGAHARRRIAPHLRLRLQLPLQRAYGVVG